MKEYTIAVGLTLNELISTVNELNKEGWQTCDDIIYCANLEFPQYSDKLIKEGKCLKY